MEMGPQLKVSSNRLVKPGIEPATPGLKGKQFIDYTTADSCQDDMHILAVCHFQSKAVCHVI